MGSPDGDLVHELAAVERARGGDHRAFVELYRQDAPPAWRLALALTGEAALAEDAVAEGFRRTLAPLRIPLPRSEVPFRVRLLAATRHAVLDASPEAALAVTGPGAERPSKRQGRAADVMTAFGALPEAWRTILWLVVVEGLGTLDAARVLDVDPAEAEALTERAQAGLRAQWVRDRQGAGVTAPAVPPHLDRELQPVLPLPLGLFDTVERRWRRTRQHDTGPLGLALPGGRPVPRWAERVLIGTTAALVALGVTSALLVDGDPARRAPAPTAAGADDHRAGSQPSQGAEGDAGSAATRLGPAERDGVTTALHATGAIPHHAGAPTGGTDPALGLAATGPTADSPMASGDDEGGEDPIPPARKPLLEVNAGTGSALGLRTGSRCTGVELGGRVVGCEPATKPSGVTVEVESSLLPGL